ncbi:hypothetical protein [Globicatella sp. PHS-GS-PNBC-21-1553]|uniref:hypothetical protein n=1 Tax=Globicatella sp. PHS-GS-PNBC-21-1553 TaxID=2885764 RepID=UPI00298F03CD|nr:hypothetical protein [Globicatella sp. PHS-GS-PNBC-21-1553]WPC08006.1 hypothetical protein LB888_08095 [Globicatella sp. PHS-GS-PNBC-21-1553]
MAKFKVLKELNNAKGKGKLKVGDIIERTVAEVEVFEKTWGKDYVERVVEPKPKK